MQHSKLFMCNGQTIWIWYKTWPYNMSLTRSSLASYPLRIDFKILLLVFKTLNGKGSDYLLLVLLLLHYYYCLSYLTVLYSLNRALWMVYERDIFLNIYQSGYIHLSLQFSNFKTLTGIEPGPPVSKARDIPLSHQAHNNLPWQKTRLIRQLSNYTK